MRVALLADIHGNAVALDAMLGDLEKIDVEQRILMGDYFLFGPRPREVYDRLREQDWPAIEGNTDRYIAAGDLQHPFADLIAWYREVLGPEALEWCEALPFEHRVESLLVVHGAPTDVEGLMITELDPWKTHPLTEAEAGAALIGDASARRIVYGHIHYASSGTVGGVDVSSIGSVGLPFDGDHRAAYAIAEWDGNDWRIEHRRLEYDWESVAREIREQAKPMSEPRAERIDRARPVWLRRR